jgi:hypothetical protein
MALPAKMVDKLSRQSIANFKLQDQQCTQVGATAEKLPAVAMNYRKGMFIYNAEAAGTFVYLGNSDVTADETEATGGFPLNGGTYMFYELDGSVDLYARSAAGNVTVYTLEVG